MDRKLNIKLYTKELQDKYARDFSCGNPHIDQFIKNPLSLDDGFGKTYVFLSDGEKEMIGFYNIGVGDVESIGNQRSYKMGGAVHINEFALDKRFHNFLIRYDEEGKKINISDLLLNDCLKRIREIRETSLGYSFVTLCSNEEGHSLYLRTNFVDLDETLDFSIETSEIKCKQMILWLDQDDYI